SYFSAADSYVDWLKHPSGRAADRDRAWRVGHEHPPLLKVWMGLTGDVLGPTVGPIAGYRSGMLLWVFLLQLLVFRTAQRHWGIFPATVASLVLLLMPRVFFHAHLATHDYAITAIWFLVVYSYDRSARRPWRITLAACFLGLALLTKINAFFLAVPLAWIWCTQHLPAERRDATGRLQAWRRALLRGALPLLVVPPLLFVTFWPWLWSHPLERIEAYLLFHLRHYEVPTYYFGEVYGQAPWHFPWLMLLVTLPALLLPLLALGTYCLRHVGWRLGGLLAVNASLPLVVVSLSPVPKFDGIRLFLPAMPFLALIVSAGFWHLERTTRRPGGRPWIAWSLAAVVLASQAWSVARYHPHQFAFFNLAIGGTPGAERLGFDVEYWGTAFREALPYLNEHPEAAYWVPVGVIHSVYRRAGLLEPQVRFGDRVSGRRLVLMNRPAMMPRDLRRLWAEEEPIFRVERFGVDLVRIYDWPR
ncbi:MAG: glycosyltransferase family 39 protein, partial [Myxococcota bacterium]